MRKTLSIDVAPQPDDVTCGPTCLHAIYRYHGDSVELSSLVDEVHMLRGGGTLDVFLANHALRRGYAATIYTYNLRVFDPSWFPQGPTHLAERLRLQSACKSSEKLKVATQGYLEFLELGGRLRFEDLTAGLLRRYLKREIPLLTGLSATYLYRTTREHPGSGDDDDIAGEPAGHFVVLAGYDMAARNVIVADPYRANPFSADGTYAVDIRRLIGAVFLGVVTYDANLLAIEPRRGARRD